MLYYTMLTMVREQRSLTALPDTLKEIINTEAWKRWRWVGSSFGQNSLSDYLTKPPPNGVGIKIDSVVKLVADDPEALMLLRREMTAEPHVHADGSNITIKPVRGTTRAYTLERLQRERPDLFDRVKAKQLSANAAAIEAGWRKPPTPFAKIIKLLPQLTEEEREQLRHLLK